MDEPDSGPIDRQVLRLLDGKLVSYPLVTSTEYVPDPYEPRQLRALFVENRYPSAVESARIEIRWFESSDFGFHYMEAHEGHTLHCRWDRHPNPHNARYHFHEPPDCKSIVDFPLAKTNPIPVLFTVLGAIEDRIERFWD
jgi:hypothetical protein